MPPSLSSQQCIMVVDDEDDIIEIVKRSLERQGYPVFGFTDPFNALEHFELEAKKYRLVISDIRMPSMNGYEFVKKIQNLQPETKVLLMSAFDISPHDFSKVLPSVRIDGFISKPALQKQIIGLVKTHMSAAKSGKLNQNDDTVSIPSCNEDVHV
jgi:DNA-binding NtrC family response regulator